MNNITFTEGIVPRSKSAGEAFWRQTLAAFAGSGQGVPAFCRDRGLKTPTFYAWRLKLAKNGPQGSCPTPAGSMHRPAFVPVRVEHRLGSTEEPIEVELRGGRVLRLPASTPAARLAEVLHALEQTGEGRP